MASAAALWSSRKPRPRGVSWSSPHAAQTPQGPHLPTGLSPGPLWGGPSGQQSRGTQRSRPVGRCRAACSCEVNCGPQTREPRGPSGQCPAPEAASGAAGCDSCPPRVSRQAALGTQGHCVRPRWSAIQGPSSCSRGSVNGVRLQDSAKSSSLFVPRFSVTS